MGIDVMIVGPAEHIASRPSDEMFGWLDRRLEEFDIRYGYIQLQEEDVRELTEKFADDDVGGMILRKVAAMVAMGDKPPYLVELMIGW